MSYKNRKPSRLRVIVRAGEIEIIPETQTARGVFFRQGPGQVVKGLQGRAARKQGIESAMRSILNPPAPE